MSASIWEAVAAIAAVASLLTVLFLPSIRRGNERRNDRKTDDIMWNGRKGGRGLPAILPMWERMDTVEATLATLIKIDERSKQLEPDGNGGHSMYDLLRKLAEAQGIDTGGVK